MTLPVRLPLLPSVLALLPLLAACASKPPARADGALPVRVPPGCEASLAGSWYHRDVPPLRYAAEDDGRTLTLTLRRPDEAAPVPASAAAPGPDAGAAPGADAGVDAAHAEAVQVTLVRTPDGFRGETRAAAYSPRGRLCPQVAFPTELVACDAGTLRVRAAAEAYIDDDCRPSARPAPPMLEHVLVRGEPPAPDAGTP